jgi:hypothetical protein
MATVHDVEAGIGKLQVMHIHDENVRHIAVQIDADDAPSAELTEDEDFINVAAADAENGFALDVAVLHQFVDQRKRLDGGPAHEALLAQSLLELVAQIAAIIGVLHLERLLGIAHRLGEIETIINRLHVLDDTPAKFLLRLVERLEPKIHRWACTSLAHFTTVLPRDFDCKRQ